MTILVRLRSFFRAIFRRPKIERELNQELLNFLELSATEKVRHGIEPSEARRLARLELGGVEQTKEQVRSTLPAAMFDSLRQDTRYAVRSLRRSPTFTAVALLSLALGIGVATATFSVLDAILLRPIPYDDPDRVVNVWASFPEWRNESGLSEMADEMTVFYPDYLDWSRRQSVFEDTAIVEYSEADWLDPDSRRSVRVGRTTHELFALLGVDASQGRLLGPGDEVTSSAVLSYRVWQQEFGGDDGVIGRAVTLEVNERRRVFTVIGVLPNGFYFGSQFGLPRPSPDMWVSGWRPDDDGEIVARLKSEVSIEQAEEETDQIFRELPFGFLSALPGGQTHGARLVSRRVEETGHTRSTLFVLFGSAGLLLMIACGNVANLLVGRAVEREHELAMRAALGAGRMRILRQCLTESFLLAGIGCGLGVIVANWGIDVFSGWIPVDFPRADQVGLDLRVLRFTLAVAMVTGIMFGLAPLLVIRSDLNNTLRRSSRGHVTARLRFQRLMIVGEIGLSFVLLVAAGLLTESLARLTAVDPGVRTGNLLTVRTGTTSSYQWSTPPSEEEMAAFNEVVDRNVFVREAVVRNVQAIPGVDAVATTMHGFPFSGSYSVTSFRVDDSVFPNANLSVRQVSPNYFEVLGIPMLNGRTFTDVEDREGLPVVVVNRAMATKYWEGQALSRQVRNDRGGVSSVIGVVENARNGNLAANPVPVIYKTIGRSVGGPPDLLIRTQVHPEGIGDEVRQAVSAADTRVPVKRMDTLESLIRASYLTDQHRTTLIAGFAVAAAILALVGLYGVMTRFVAYRKHELSIRAALGAQSGELLRLVLRHSLGLTIMGIVLGIGGATAAIRLISGFLFGVSPIDTGTYAGIATGLILVSLAASYIPARRAARCDPMAALRIE